MMWPASLTTWLALIIYFSAYAHAVNLCSRQGLSAAWKKATESASSLLEPHNPANVQSGGRFHEQTCDFGQEDSSGDEYVVLESYARGGLKADQPIHPYPLEEVTRFDKEMYNIGEFLNLTAGLNTLGDNILAVNHLLVAALSNLWPTQLLYYSENRMLVSPLYDMCKDKLDGPRKELYTLKCSHYVLVSNFIRRDFLKNFVKVGVDNSSKKFGVRLYVQLPSSAFQLPVERYVSPVISRQIYRELTRMQAVCDTELCPIQGETVNVYYAYSASVVECAIKSVVTYLAVSFLQDFQQNLRKLESTNLFNLVSSDSFRITPRLALNGEPLTSVASLRKLYESYGLPLYSVSETGKHGLRNITPSVINSGLCLVWYTSVGLREQLASFTYERVVLLSECLQYDMLKVRTARAEVPLNSSALASAYLDTIGELGQSSMSTFYHRTIEHDQLPYLAELVAIQSNNKSHVSAVTDGVLNASVEHGHNATRFRQTLRFLEVACTYHPQLLILKVIPFVDELIERRVPIFPVAMAVLRFFQGLHGKSFVLPYHLAEPLCFYLGLVENRVLLLRLKNMVTLNGAMNIVHSRLLKGSTGSLVRPNNSKDLSVPSVPGSQGTSCFKHG